LFGFQLHPFDSLPSLSFHHWSYPHNSSREVCGGHIAEGQEFAGYLTATGTAHLDIHSSGRMAAIHSTFPFSLVRRLLIAFKKVVSMSRICEKYCSVARPSVGCRGTRRAGHSFTPFRGTSGGPMAVGFLTFCEAEIQNGLKKAAPFGISRPV
jgi:hypothetical protein